MPKCTFFYLCVLLFLVLSARLGAAVLYVDVDASGLANGDSWGNAFTDLRSATDVAVGGDQIWVAEGTYYPTSTSTRTESFFLASGVALYGGFAGTESELSQRNADPLSNGCVLSGDLAEDDLGQALDFQNYGDNSLSLVDIRGATDVIVDGFKITGGNANLSNGNRERGAGVYLWENDSARLENLWFDRNLSDLAGGAIYTNQSSVVVVRCFFTNNRAQFGGAAYLNRGDASLLSCQFLGNEAIEDGGALQAFHCEMTANYCSFSGNTAADQGGAAYLNHSAFIAGTMDHCTFANNEAVEVGAVYLHLGQLVAKSSVFWGNKGGTDSDYGPGAGALHLWSSGNLVDIDPLFEDELGEDEMAGTLDDNLLLSFDSPGYDTGATINGDPFDVNGDGNTLGSYPIDAAGNSTTVRKATDKGAFENATPRIYYVNSNVVGSAQTGLSWENATATLGEALAFVIEGDQIWMAKGVYRPVFDDRSAAVAPIKKSVSIYGGFRGDETSTFRRPSAISTRYATILSGERGTSVRSDNIEQVVVIGSGLTVHLDRLTIQGAYGSQRGAGIAIGSDSDVRISRCRIQNNHSDSDGAGLFTSDPRNLRVEWTTFSDNSTQRSGGGLQVSYNFEPVGTITLSELVFTRNSAIMNGGGASIANGHDTSLSRCTFFRNEAGSFGGGLQLGGLASIERCGFVENIGSEAGAAFLSNSNTPETKIQIEGTAFLGNSANSGASAIRSGNNESIEAVNCLFTGNTGNWLIAAGPTIELVNCSLVGNRGISLGSTLLNVQQNDGNIIFRNSVFDADPDQLARLYDMGDDTLAIESSFVEGETGFDNPEFFRDPSPGDGNWNTYSDNDYGYLKPREGSPLLDAGNNDFMLAATDFTGRIRLENEEAVIDIGAFEGIQESYIGRRYPYLAGGDANLDGIPDSRALLLGRSPFEDDAQSSELKIFRDQDSQIVIEFDHRVDSDTVELALIRSSDLANTTITSLDDVEEGMIERTSISPARERVRIVWDSLIRDEQSHFLEIGNSIPQ